MGTVVEMVPAQVGQGPIRTTRSTNGLIEDDLALLCEGSPVEGAPAPALPRHARVLPSADSPLACLPAAHDYLQRGAWVWEIPVAQQPKTDEHRGKHSKQRDDSAVSWSTDTAATCSTDQSSHIPEVRLHPDIVDILGELLTSWDEAA